MWRDLHVLAVFGRGVGDVCKGLLDPRDDAVAVGEGGPFFSIRRVDKNARRGKFNSSHLS